MPLKDYRNRRWPSGLKRFLAVTRPMDSLGPNWKEVCNIQYGQNPMRRLRFAVGISTKNDLPAGCVFASYLYHPMRVGGDGISRWWNSPKIFIGSLDLPGWHRLVSILHSLGDRPDLKDYAGTMLCVLSIGEHWRHENFGSYNAGLGVIKGKAGRDRLYVGELRPVVRESGETRLLCTPKGITLGLGSTETISKLGQCFRDLLSAMETAREELSMKDAEIVKE